MTGSSESCPWGQGRFASLDGWRALSIILVVGAHSQRAEGFPPLWGPTVNVLFDGGLGVRCFFIISGFLITTLLLREKWTSGTINLRSFYLRRVVRIFPVYFAFLGFIAIVESQTPFDQSTRQWWHLLTFTSNFSPDSNWPTGHTWSLACEEQFYLIWPFSMVFLGLTSWRPRVGLVLAIPVLIAPFCRVATYLEVLPDSRLFNLFSLLNYQDSLAVGCLLAYAHPSLKPMMSSRHVPWIVCGSLAAILLPHLLGHFLIWGRVTVPLGPTLQAVGMALLMSLTMHQPHRGLVRWFNLPLVVWIGVLSYSIYIWQQFFCSRPSLFGWESPLSMVFPLWIAAAFAAAVVSFYLVEKPLLQLRKQL
jgi:peptidoglycan/LPS O-acetylase OafA/YrhL